MSLTRDSSRPYRAVGTRDVVFAGVARNCAAWLPAVLDNLDRLSRLYVRSAFVFAVSDSEDDSQGVLERWVRAGRDGKVLDLGTLAERLPVRTERIAAARNACLETIAASPWAGYDHLAVADLDDVLAAPMSAAPYAAAASWLDADPARAAVFANAAPRYYDVWALRHENWCPHDCWHPIWGRQAGDSFEAAKFREVFSRQIVLPPELAPVEVRSAFGGLAIYRMSFARDIRYRGVDGSGRESSEHVTFNEAIGRAGGRLYIFPSLQVSAPHQHLYQTADFTLRWRLAMHLRSIAEKFRPPWRRLVARP